MYNQHITVRIFGVGIPQSKRFSVLAFALFSYSNMFFFPFLLGIIAANSVVSRKWNNTGTGSIVFEEAWTVPDLLIQVG